MRWRFATHAVIAFVVLLSAAVARGTPIAFELEGEVSVVVDYYGTLAGLIEAGDAYIARFVVESTTPDRDPNDITRGLYDILSAELIVGQVTFSANQGDGTIRVTDTSTYDKLNLLSECSSVPDLGTAVLDTSFHDKTGGVFSSDALPLPASAPDIAAFQEVFFQTNLDDGKFIGTTTSLTVVPEPGTLALFALFFATVFRRLVPR